MNQATPQRLVAVILAGGLSRRMGGHAKALRLLNNKRIILHVADRLLPQVAAVAINGGLVEYQNLGYPVFADHRPQAQGPLAGVETALLECRAPWVLTVSCDTPFLPLDLARRLCQATETGPPVPVAIEHGERLHPTVCLWPQENLPLVQAALDAGERRLAAWFASHPHHRVRYTTEAGAVDPFFNINTPEDLLRAEALLEAGTVL